MENEKMEMVTEDEFNGSEEFESRGIGTGLAMAIGAGLALAGAAGVKKVKKMLAKRKSKFDDFDDELFEEEEIIIDAEENPKEKKKK